MALTWDARTMQTGHDEIDAQHQELIQHLNRFFEMMKKGSANDSLNEFVDFLSQYALWHFSHEEQCMDAYRCPVAAVNKMAHNNFIRIFRGYRSRLVKEGPTTALVIEVQREVSKWVRNHLVRTDTQLRPCVQKVFDPGASLHQ
jgi:hemerythrin